MFAASKDRYGYRRVKAALLTRVSAKAVRRIMKEDGLTAHVSERRRHSSYEGETTPAPRQTPPTATSPPRLRTGSGRRTSPGSRPGTRRACLSPTVNRHDGKIVAYTAGFSPNAEFNGMLVKAAETLPEGGARPLVHSDHDRHCRWPGWLDLVERYKLTRSTGAKGCSPDNAAAEGFFGRVKTEPAYPGHWEEHAVGEVLVPVDDCIQWYNHERIKQSLGWMSPIPYRQS